MRKSTGLAGMLVVSASTPGLTATLSTPAFTKSGNSQSVSVAVDVGGGPITVGVRMIGGRTGTTLKCA